MLGGVKALGLEVPTSADDFVSVVQMMDVNGLSPTNLSACPLMHGTGMWLGTMVPLLQGGTVVTISRLGLDPNLMWGEVERVKATNIVIVGDAFARPMLQSLQDARAAGDEYDLSSLNQIISSGVMWSSEVKAGLLEFKDMVLIDAMGSTEGGMGSAVSSREKPAATAKFQMSQGTKVFDDDFNEVQPGSGVVGRLATSGLVPLGYFKDPEKSAATFVEVGGLRYSFPGDFATVDADGSIKLLGRGSYCINTAGEKVYPEEVEEAVKKHPDVNDCLVVGMPDERFGQRIVVVASINESSMIDEQSLIDFAREHLAGYKLPKQVVLAEEVRRAPNGKADYKWARETAASNLR